MKSLWTLIHVIFMLGSIFGIAALPAVIVISFINGNNKAGIISSIVFVTWIIVFKVWLTVSDKLSAKREKKYKERFVTDMDIDCGSFGIITLEHDRGRDMIVSKGVLTELMLISVTDMIELCINGDTVDGRQLERIMNRLRADKDRIQEGFLCAYENCFPSTGKYYPGTPLELRLKLITVNRDCIHIDCEGQFTGIRDEIYATVSFEDGIFDYKYDIEE